jgi:hypothetical protein
LILIYTFTEKETTMRLTLVLLFLFTLFPSTKKCQYMNIGEVMIMKVSWQKHMAFLNINKKNEVKEESFSYPERGKHLLGVKLVKLSSQSSSIMGYKSDILTNYPTKFFPITYPIFTFVLGIILLVIGMIRFRLKNNK